MRKPLVAGNWKMHGSMSQAKSLIETIKTKAKPELLSQIDILLCPPFLYLNLAHELIQNSTIQLGAQNLYLGAQGAFTGEISGVMLKDIGCRYVLIGHSERRHILKEDLSLVAAKFKAAIDAGLTPVLCVGETKEEREQAQTETVIAAQINSVMQLAGVDSFHQAVIAYEPVWAIGTGLTASPEQAEEVHAFIRTLIQKNNIDLAKTIRILYGGSVKAENAAALFAMRDVDGGLIGGASLDAASFLAICEAASHCHLERTERITR